MSSEQSSANKPSHPGADPPGPTEIRDDWTETRTVGAKEAEIGTVIGPDQLLQLIGQGGMGEVWLAEQKH